MVLFGKFCLLFMGVIPSPKMAIYFLVFVSPANSRKETGITFPMSAVDYSLKGQS